MLADPLGGVRDWTSYFAHLQIPILRRTARALAAFAGDEEAIATPNRAASADRATIENVTALDSRPVSRR